MSNTSEWHVNTGTVPEGVGPDTVIEVEYRDGLLLIVSDLDPCEWEIDGCRSDIIRWRFAQ